MRLSFAAVTLAAFLALSPAVAPAQTPPADAPGVPATQPANGAAREAAVVDLPVTRAVLFSSGVGYFEHAGEIDGSATMRLLFKAEQINDVLKSMVVMDQGDGHVSAVSYPSNEPIGRALRSFSVDLSGAPSLPDLLQQLRGAEVIVMAPERIEGKILSVEARTKVVGQPPTQVTEYVLTLVTASGLRSIPMESVASITLQDPGLQEELNKALALLVQSRDAERKPVEVQFQGEGRRQVRVGYLVETPVWKSTYRLDLGHAAQQAGNGGARSAGGAEGEAAAASEDGEGDGKALLQGWAIVENTSESDWQNVALALVSGRPISFRMDLYTPMYLERPLVTPQLYAFLRPRMYEEGIREEYFRDVEAEAAGTGGGGRRLLEARAQTAAPGGPAAAQAGQAADMDFAYSENTAALMRQAQAAEPISLAQGIQAMASGGSLGELFHYALRHPVDLARRRSAMLPIINQDVKANRVSIYNASVMPDRPLNGVVLINDTDLKLLSGPVTIFEEGAYAGDAQIDHLAPGDRRLLSYSVDLAVTVQPSVEQAQQIVAARIERGILQLTRLHTYTQTYTVLNKATRERDLIIEHPLVHGRELIEPRQAWEKTDALYRFRFEVAGEEKRAFTVKERLTNSEGIAILPLPIDTLVAYLQTGEIDEKVRDALARAVELKRQLADLQARHAQLQQELNEIMSGQDRLRQNINTVGAGSTLGQRYLQKLGQEEDRIEELQSQIEELQEQINAKQAELNDYVADLDVRPGR